jgi:hypothetical protein
LEQETYVCVLWRKTRKADYMWKNKIYSLVTCHITHHMPSFRPNMGWCVHSMQKNELSLHRRLTLPEIATRFWGEACCFSVTCRHQQMNIYILSQTANTGGQTAYYDMLSNYVTDTGAFSVVVNTHLTSFH